jgi:hypothetical protein
MLWVCCSKLHPEMGEVLLREPPAGSSSNLPAVLRLCGKLDMLDQVRTTETQAVNTLVCSVMTMA